MDEFIRKATLAVFANNTSSDNIMFPLRVDANDMCIMAISVVVDR